MYGKNVAYIVIRPQRYTKEFVDRENTFSLSFFDKDYRKTLNYLGTVSGRTENKISKSGLTLVSYEDTPYFDEANHVLICKKLFRQPLGLEGLLEEKLVNTWYRNGDPHTLYIAEITKILRIRHTPKIE
jgi:flavin reductase (DIM6/NTAB) family NADH-FMN oxidoreductase RutF